MTMNDGVGYKSVGGQSSDSLRWRLMQSPTGRQLAIDGNFVDTFVAADPSLDPAFRPPDGTTVMWVNGTHLVRSTFTRATSWCAVEQTP